MTRRALLGLVLSTVLLSERPVEAEPRGLPAVLVSHRDSLFDIATCGDDIFVVGYPGLVLRSEDGGAHFARVGVGTSQALFAIDVLEDGRGVVVGRGGIVLTTTDGGRSWTQRNSGTEASLFDVDMMPDGRTWAVGHFGTILHSADAGLTWTEQTYDPALPVEEGAAEGNTRSVAEEENEGAAVEARLNGVAFTGDGLGFVVGEFGIVLVTRDGGEHWTRLAAPTGTLLFDVHVEGTGRVAAVGAEGTWLASEDAGAHWTVVDAGTSEHLLAVTTRDGRAVATTYDGRVLSRGDDGKIEVHASGSKGWVGSVVFPSPTFGLLAGGNGTLCTTHDGGRSFVRVLGETAR